MSLYGIGDLHLSFGTDKPMDIFGGWKDYVEKIKENWIKNINENDFVSVPGDISWAMNLDEFEPDARFLNELPGTKLVFKGNHDYWWTSLSKMNAFLKQNNFDTIKIIHNSAYVAGSCAVCGTRGWFYDECADKKVLLREAGRLESSITEAEKTGLEPVVFLHYPPLYGSFECAEILEVLQRRNIKSCYYGHLHGNAVYKAVTGICRNIDFKLISSDYLNFIPALIKKE